MKKLIRLSAPVAISQLSLVGIGVTDVLVAGRAGTDELAGLMLGNNLWHLVAFFFFGIGLATQPMIGYAFGAGDMERVRRVFQNALYAAIATGVVCSIAVWSTVLWLPRLGYEPALAAIGGEYMRFMVWAAVAICVIPVLRSSLEAMNQTAPVTRILIAGFLINIPLDIVLVFGFGPIPALGGAGCAVASVVVLWGTVALLVMLARSGRNAHLKLFPLRERPDRQLLVEYLKLGLPIGATILAELSFFAIAALLVAFFGALAASAHSVALSTASVLFMFYMGLGQGMAIRSSQLLGAGDLAAARFSVRVGVEMTLGLALVLSLALLLLRHQLPWLYTSDMEVAALAAVLLGWAALFQLADAMQCVGMYGLRAYKDTISPIFCQLVSFWVIAFPVGFWLARNDASPLAGPQGYWVGMCLGLMTAAALIGVQLKRRITRIERSAQTTAA